MKSIEKCVETEGGNYSPASGHDLNFHQSMEGPMGWFSREEVSDGIYHTHI